jgi:hypothetical protein
MFIAAVATDTSTQTIFIMVKLISAHGVLGPHGRYTSAPTKSHEFSVCEILL